MRKKAHKGAVARCTNVIIFDYDGNIHGVRRINSVLRPGNNIRQYMRVDEWRYLRRNCTSFASFRIFADTDFGSMIVLCRLMGAMRLLVGVVVCGDRGALAQFYSEQMGLTDSVSPHIAQLLKKESEKRRVELCSKPLDEDGVKMPPMEWVEEDLLSFLERNILLWARIGGCRVTCRKTEQSMTERERHIFDGDSFMAVMILLLFFLRRCPKYAALVELGCDDGRPMIRFSCRLPQGEHDIWSFHKHRYIELERCEELAVEKRFFLTFDTYAKDGETHLCVSFCPTLFPYEELRIKEPIKKLER